MRLRAAGKLTEAIAAAEKMLAIERELLAELRSAGRTNAARRMELDLVGSLRLLGELYEQRELPKEQPDFRPAEAARKEALERLSRLLPPGHHQHYRVADAEIALGYVERLARLSLDERHQLRVADRLNARVYQLWRAGRSREAIPLAKRAVEIRRTLLGQEHPLYALSLFNLAAQYDAVGDDAKAEGLYKQAADIQHRVLGGEHPAYATTLNNLAGLYAGLGDLSRAEALYQQVLAIRKKTLGRRHASYASALNNLAWVYAARADYTRAETLLREALEVKRKTFGERHPAYASSLANLARVYTDMGRFARAESLYRQTLQIRKYAQGEGHPDYASDLCSLARLYDKMGDYPRAERLYRQALEIRKNVLGEKHPGVADSLNSLAVLYLHTGAYMEAESLLRQSDEILRSTLGPEHPNRAAVLSNMAQLYTIVGDYARAIPLYQRAIQIFRKALGEEHSSLATSLNSLGAVYRKLGEYGRAQSLLREALRLRKRVLGEQDPDYATVLNNLAMLYHDMGDYSSAESLYLQVAEIRKKALGREHPEYGVSLNNLANVCQDVGDYDRAEVYYRQAASILEKALGKEHPNYATALNNLGNLHHEMGHYQEAEALYRQALELGKTALGEEHPDYVIWLQNLASLYYELGDYARSEPLYRQALEVRDKVLGKQHPQYASSLRGLGILFAATGRTADGEKLLRQGLSISEKLRDRIFAIQAERQRLRWTASTRFHLDRWLSVAPEAGVPAAAMHSAVLRWKGAVLQRQREDHLAGRRPELKPLVEELNSMRSRWATLALAVPEPAKRELWQRQLHQLMERKEALESELARKSAAFRQGRRLAQLSSEELAAHLPPHVVFVDFLVYSHIEPTKGKAQAELRLVAFVLRRGHETVRLELGPVEPVEEAIETWRHRFGTDADGQKAAAELGRRLLEPLRPYVAGAELLLVAPDGPLCRFPLAALPGQEPDTYLIEELAVGYVASGRHLAELLGVGAEREENQPRATGLLLAGGIEYDASLERKPEAEDGLMVAAGGRTRSPVGLGERLRGGFGFLPGTRLEAERVAAEFRSIAPDQPELLLSGAEADEGRMKEELSRGWRYVHLATHGFFAPPEKLSAWRAGLDDDLSSASRQMRRLYSPLLLSGLVFAGVGGGEEGEDGVLTAEEVAALDLEGTDLVVLSACDTGLGEVAGGEGVLGLQRAFHVAGARTVVSSLWRVDDAATSLLMEKFYRNLWQGGMGPLEALRQAQLFVLRHPDRVQQRAEELAARLRERGLKFEPTRLPPASKRSHPGLWAGFFLSGKWWSGNEPPGSAGSHRANTPPQ